MEARPVVAELCVRLFEYIQVKDKRPELEQWDKSEEMALNDVQETKCSGLEIWMWCGEWGEDCKEHSLKAEGLGDILPDLADKHQSEKQCDVLGS